MDEVLDKHRVPPLFLSRTLSQKQRIIDIGHELIKLLPDTVKPAKMTEDDTNDVMMKQLILHCNFFLTSTRRAVQVT